MPVISVKPCHLNDQLPKLVYAIFFTYSIFEPKKLSSMKALQQIYNEAAAQLGFYMKRMGVEVTHECIRFKYDNTKYIIMPQFNVSERVIILRTSEDQGDCIRVSRLIAALIEMDDKSVVYLNGSKRLTTAKSFARNYLLNLKQYKDRIFFPINNNL
jgi:hypothetical protein